MYHDNHEILYHDISYITIIVVSLIHILLRLLGATVMLMYETSHQLWAPLSPLGHWVGTGRDLTKPVIKYPTLCGGQAHLPFVPHRGTGFLVKEK